VDIINAFDLSAPKALAIGGEGGGLGSWVDALMPGLGYSDHCVSVEADKIGKHQRGQDCADFEQAVPPAFLEGGYDFEVLIFGSYASLLSNPLLKRS